MLDKKHLNKISLLFSSISIVLILLACFNFQFDGISVASVPSFSISLLAPVNNIIIDFCGASLGNIIISIIINIYYIICKIIIT